MPGKHRLIDVEKQSRLHPDSFFIPSRAEREGLEVGQVVQLHFLPSLWQFWAPNERMWVEIVEVHPGGYRGVLQSAPRFIRGLAEGDDVEFACEHVGSVLIPRGHPDWFENASKTAIVSERVLADSCRFAYRESPEDPDDSGWRLLSGSESPDQLADPSQVRVCRVSYLCARDESLREVLRVEDNVAYQRSGPRFPWRPAAYPST